MPVADARRPEIDPLSVADWESRRLELEALLGRRREQIRTLEAGVAALRATGVSRRQTLIHITVGFCVGAVAGGVAAAIAVALVKAFLHV